jgi:hypothetical protein
MLALDYNIAFIFSSCSTERIGRNMTLTKPPERSSLGDENFKMLVWVSYNSPPVHEIDFEKYIAIWTTEKHQLALFKEGGGEQRVLTRKSLEHKHTILSTRVTKQKFGFNNSFSRLQQLKDIMRELLF